MSYSIAIDGPSGAGKSTLAKAIAARLGFYYVDTGAIYRTVGLYVARQGGDCANAEDVTPRLSEIAIGMEYGEDGLQHMILNGEDVTTAIRENAVSKYASQVSAIPAVRDFLLEMQRDLARKHSVIMDGRDIGTVVLPDADVKIYLTASVEQRALRRWKELQEKGDPTPLETVQEQIEQRDYADTHRETAPLRKAEDAVVLSKRDLPPRLRPEDLRRRLTGSPEILTASVLEPNGLADLKAFLARKAKAETGLAVTLPRHLDAIRRARGHLRDALRTLETGPLDLCSVDLQSAQEALCEITGERAGEKLLDEVFSAFCVGK